MNCSSAEAEAVHCEKLRERAEVEGARLRAETEAAHIDRCQREAEHEARVAQLQKQWLDSVAKRERSFEAACIDERTRLQALVVKEEEIQARVAEMRRLGLFGMTIPEEFGGLGLSMEQQVRATFEFTRASCVYRARFSTTLGLCSQAILFNGTE